MIVGIFAVLLICIFLYRQAYYEFIKAVPAFTTIAQVLQKNPGLTGADPNLLIAPIETAKGATYSLVARAIAAFITFTIAMCAILGAGNAYIWSKLRNAKIKGKEANPGKHGKEKNLTLKRAGSFALTSLVMQAVWTIIMLLTVWLYRSPKVVFLFALYIIAVPFSYTAAYSYTDEKIGSSLKKMFTRPFLKIHHYILASALMFLTFALTTNILFGAMYIAFPKTLFEWGTSLTMVIIILSMTSWMRYYMLEIQEKNHQAHTN